jgi:PAS domain S-box-containing protein
MSFEGVPIGSGDDVRAAVGEAILSSVSDAIVAADADGRIVFWNPGAERIFGYRAPDAIGRSLDIIIPERLRAQHWEGYGRVMSGAPSRYGSGDILAVPAVTSDDRRISIEFTIVALHDRAGKLTGVAAVIRDVTKRFEEMRALRRALAGRTSAAPES